MKTLALSDPIQFLSATAAESPSAAAGAETAASAAAHDAFAAVLAGVRAGSDLTPDTDEAVVSREVSALDATTVALDPVTRDTALPSVALETASVATAAMHMLWQAEPAPKSPAPELQATPNPANFTASTVATSPDAQPSGVVADKAATDAAIPTAQTGGAVVSPATGGDWRQGKHTTSPPGQDRTTAQDVAAAPAALPLQQTPSADATSAPGPRVTAPIPMSPAEYAPAALTSDALAAAPRGPSVSSASTQDPAATEAAFRKAPDSHAGASRSAVLASPQAPPEREQASSASVRTTETISEPASSERKTPSMPTKDTGHGVIGAAVQTVTPTAEVQQAAVAATISPPAALIASRTAAVQESSVDPQSAIATANPGATVASANPQSANDFRQHTAAVPSLPAAGERESIVTTTARDAPKTAESGVATVAQGVSVLMSQPIFAGVASAMPTAKSSLAESRVKAALETDPAVSSDRPSDSRGTPAATAAPTPAPGPAVANAVTTTPAVDDRAHEKRDPDPAKPRTDMVQTATGGSATEMVGRTAESPMPSPSTGIDTPSTATIGGGNAVSTTAATATDRATALFGLDATGNGPHKAASPHAIAHQMAQGLTDAGNRTVELTLSPEELGKVRMTLHSTETSITVAVQADRPETLDLMRRNIDSLARDFREMGYANVDFDFGQQPDRQPSAQDGSARDPSVPQPVAERDTAPRFDTTSIAIQSSRTTSGGLDLRI